MCGIAGAVGAVDDEVVASVRAMQSELTHRGPDAGGLWQGGGVVLAHRRLSILDLSEGGAQPMSDRARGHTLVYNGELYNYRALRDELAAKGERFASDSDTEVLLKLCASEGVEPALPRTRGMFAFALWDSQAQKLHLVRDRMGVKPLYYVELPRPGGKVTLFASELRSLLASGLVERRLDPEGVRTYLWNGFVTDPGTIIRGVRSLPPGHRLEIAAEGSAREPRRWWKLPSSVMVPGARDALGESLAEAVRLRLVADVPLGVFLSGGVDSSAVAALARRSPGELKTFCVGFPEVELDESGHAEAVARALGTEHVTVPLEEQDFSSRLPQALDSLDQPTFDAVNTWFVSRAVKDAGITVALAGTGGDELFGGYTSFADLPRAERVARALASAPMPVLERLSDVATRIKTGPPGEVRPQTRWGKLADVLATRGERVPLYQVSYGLFTRDFLAQLAGPSHGAGDERWGLSASLFRQLDALARDEPVLHAVTLLELSLFLGNRLLRDTDAASMASSLEVRVPLIDHDVVEKAAGVLPERRCQPVQRKDMLKALALDGAVDRSLIDREKAGFVLPFDAWCRRSLRSEMEAAFTDHETLLSLGLAPDAVARLWRSFLERAPGIYWSRIWSLFILSRWCRAHGVRR